MGKALLALNCGSSSLKSTLFSYPDLVELASVSASSIGSDSATLKYKSANASSSGSGSNSGSGSRSVKGESHADIFEDVLSELEQRAAITHKEDVVIVTHRIVHGGTFDKPVTVTREHQEALQRLEELSAFAPLHNSAAVETVKAVLERLPTAKNLLCFDTLVRIATRLHPPSSSNVVRLMRVTTPLPAVPPLNP
jgi:acetate kinase